MLNAVTNVKFRQRFSIKLAGFNSRNFGLHSVNFALRSVRPISFHSTAKFVKFSIHLISFYVNSSDFVLSPVNFDLRSACPNSFHSTATFVKFSIHSITFYVNSSASNSLFQKVLFIFKN